MSSVYLDKLDISCNWNASSERNIKDTVTLGNIEDDGITAEISDLVSLETCVQLNSPGPSSPSPELNFTIVSDVAISSLKIVSEARIIELYGKGGEYVSTTHSDFLDDFEGMSVYSAVVKLPISSSECSIKFQKLKNQDSIWIYGMGVYVQPTQDEDQSGAHVDFRRVNDRLQQSGCSLSGNAEQCRELLHMFQTFSYGESKAYPNTSSEDGKTPQNFGNAETYKKMFDLFLTVSPQLCGFRSTSQGSPSVQQSFPSFQSPQQPDKVIPGSQTPMPTSSSVSDEIKTLIAEQFQRLENCLIAKVDERLKNIEEKLNMVMLKLQMQSLTLDS